MNPSQKLAEIAREVGDLERAHEVLIAIVRAKISGEPNPEAWATAFAIEEAARVPTSGRSETVRCPECRKILIVPDTVSTDDDAIDVDTDPIGYDCGPTHVLKYNGFQIEVDDDGATLRRSAKVDRVPFLQESDGNVPR